MDDDGFQTAIAGTDKPVFAKFVSYWDGNCKTIGPKLNDLAEKYDGNAVFIQVDVDQSQ